MTTSTPQRGPGGRRMDQKFVKRRQRGLAVLVASLILLIGAVIYIGVQISGGGETVADRDYQGSGNGVHQLVEIPEGSSVSQLGPELEERGIVKTDSAFQTAAANNPDAGSIQPGFYRLQGEMSAAAAVQALTGSSCSTSTAVQRSSTSTSSAATPAPASTRRSRV